MVTEAVIFTGRHEVVFGRVECRDPGPDDVVVATAHSWISNGTEGSYLRGERSDGDTPFAEGDPYPFPVVAGYQRVGTVEWTGNNVEGLAPGDSVFATIGHVHHMHHDYGGQLRRSVSTADEVLRLPPNDDPLKYAGLVLTQVGWNAGSRPFVTPGDFAVVVGDGLVGHWTAQTLLSRGANVILVGKHDYRLDHFAGRAGASVVNTCRDDWVGAAREIAGPEGYRIGVDTVGSVEIMDTLATTTNRFGDIVSAGFYGADDHFRLQPARYGEHTIHLISGWTRARLKRTLEAVSAGDLETTPLITHHFAAEDAASAWQLIEDKAQAVLGVVLDW
jgi:2-desacetyl-2-hydroxyethyl bacteriochlorophyllide A dehydrogenase